MGALHDGHRSLIPRAAEECDVVAVSIFVNPTQFGDPADLADYPRTLDGRPRGSGIGRRRSSCSPRRSPRCTRTCPGTRRPRVSVPALRRPVGGCLPARPLRRGGHGGGQAAVRRRSMPGLLRGEGLPAAGPGPRGGPGPLPARPRWSGAPRAGCRRPGPVQPERPARSPSERRRRPRAVAGPAGRAPNGGRRRAEPGRGGGGDGTGGGERAAGGPGLRRRGARRRPRAGPVLCLRPPAPPA